jgi:hypothetical protein
MAISESRGTSISITISAVQPIYRFHSFRFFDCIFAHRGNINYRGK